MIITRRQLAKKLQISDRKVARLEKQGLPVMKLGNNTHRYDFDMVILFLQEMKSKIQDE